MRFALRTYSLLVLCGGFFGYRSGSLVSLIMGGLFGLALFVMSFPSFFKKKYCQIAALILVFILDAVFSWRFIKAPSFFPAGFFSLLSLSLLLLLAKYRSQDKNPANC